MIDICQRHDACTSQLWDQRSNVCDLSGGSQGLSEGVAGIWPEPEIAV